jgi:hypothetical protein
MSDMLTNWRRLTTQTIDAIRPGLEAGADIIEADAAQTTAYRGMSGATRASTIAYVADVGDRGDAEILSAYNAAAGLLQGFQGHEGQPHLGLVRGPGAHEAWIILTVPTDYILSLETEAAGEKAFLADTLHQDAPQAFNALVAALRGAWHR